MTHSKCTHRDPARLGRRAFLIAAGAAAAVIGAAGRAEAADAPVEPFLGKYRHAGGDKERQARDKAIDDVVAGMSVLVRGVARERLKDASAIAASIELASDGKALTVSADGHSYTAPLDGTAVKVKVSTGDEMTLRYAIRAGQIDQVFGADERGRTNRCRFDGKKLAVTVTVHSSELPKSLVYRLTYERA